MSTIDKMAQYLKNYFLVKTGNNTMTGHLLVDTASVYDLGSASHPYRAVYADSLVGSPGSFDQLVRAGVGDGVSGFLDDKIADGSLISTSLIGTTDKQLQINVVTTSLLLRSGANSLQGNLAVDFGVTIDGVDLDVHAADENAHHNKQHDIVDSVVHTVTGSQYDVIGLPSLNTLGVLSTTSNGASNFNTILRSGSAGELTVTTLNANTKVRTNLIDTASGHLTLTPAERIELSDNKEIRSVTSVTGLFGTGWRLENPSGASFLDIRKIQVEELRAYLFIADFVRVQIGEDFITESMGVLYSDMTTPAVSSTTTLIVEDVPFFSGALFADNDYVMLALIDRSGGGINIARAWGQVSGYTDLGADSEGVTRQSWTYTHRSGTVGLVFKKGSIVMGWGQSGQGYIHHSVVDSGGSPYTRYATWITNPYTPANRTIHTQVGNLNSVTDAVLNPTGYGIYSTNAFFKGVVVAGNGNVKLDSEGAHIATDDSGITVENRLSLHELTVDGDELGYFGGRSFGGGDFQVMIGATGASGSNWGTVAIRATSATNGLPIGTNDNVAGILLVMPGSIYIGPNVGLRVASVVDELATVVPGGEIYADTIHADTIVAGVISGAVDFGAEWQHNSSLTIDANSADDTTVTVVNEGAGRADLVVDRNITLGGTIDGIDLNVFEAAYTAHLSSDSHNYYVHIATSRTITAVHQFNPSTATAPFTLGTNGQGQTIIGLKADQLSKQVISGSGLTGGGGLTTDITINIGAGDGITVNVDDIAVNTTVLRTNTAQTITVQHTFNPVVAQAPFILGANAIDQLVAGLNADKLDGLDQIAFMRKSADSDLDMNQFDILDVDDIQANTLVLFGIGNPSLTVGTTTTGAAKIGKVTFLFATDDFTISSSTNTDEFFISGFSKFDIDIASIVLGASSGSITIRGTTNLSATNWSISSGGALTMASGLDVEHTISRTLIGHGTEHATWMLLRNSNQDAATEFAIGQDNSGTTIVNAATGQRVYLQINNDSGVFYDGTMFAPVGSYLKDLGAYNAKWRTLYAAELYVETLVAQDVLATIGGRILVSPTTALIADSDTLATTIDVKHNNLRNGEYVILMTAPGGIAQFEIMKVTSSATTITGGFRYTVERNKDGSGINEWFEGDAVASLQKDVGEGYIELTSTNTIHSHIGPNITIYARTATTNWNDVVPVISMGNLDSWVGYGIEFGFAVGNNLLLTPTTGFKGLTADRTNGIRLFSVNLQSYNGSIQTTELSSSDGSLKLGSNITSGTTTTFDFTGTSGVLRVGPVGSGKPNLYWDGTNLDIRNNTTSIIRMNASGQLIIGNDVTLTPSTGLKGIIADNTNGLSLYNVDIDLYAGSTKIGSFNDDFGLEFQNYQSSPSDSKRKISWWNLSSRSDSDSTQLWSQVFSNNRTLFAETRVTDAGTTSVIQLIGLNSGTGKQAKITISSGNNTGQINAVTMQSDNITLSGDGVNTVAQIIGSLTISNGTLTTLTLLSQTSSLAIWDSIVIGDPAASTAAAYSITMPDGLGSVNGGNGRELIIQAGSSNNDTGLRGGHLTLRGGDPISPSTTYGDVYIQDQGGNLYVATNTDRFAHIGRARIGYFGASDFAGFGHLDMPGVTQYAILQQSNGETYINAASGTNINFRINNSQIGIWSASLFTVNTNAYFDLNVSALTFTDRTPYPETLEEAIDSVKSFSKSEEYDKNDKSKQLDHSKLHTFVKSEDGRDLSATVSALLETVKYLLDEIDLLKKK
jgi:hypothetical protein